MIIRVVCPGCQLRLALCVDGVYLRTAGSEATSAARLETSSIALACPQTAR
jgi:hypothetical protein